MKELNLRKLVIGGLSFAVGVMELYHGQTYILADMMLVFGGLLLLSDACNAKFQGEQS